MKPPPITLFITLQFPLIASVAVALAKTHQREMVVPLRIWIAINASVVLKSVANAGPTSDVLNSEAGAGNAVSSFLQVCGNDTTTAVASYRLLDSI